MIINDKPINESLFVSSAQMIDANNYNDWTFSLFRQYLKGSILEVGCGVGSFTRRIIEHGGFNRLLSIDISSDAVAYSSEKFIHPKVKFQCIDVRALEGKFDTIICMNVLEHIEDDHETFEHLIDVLNTGGTLFLLVPAHQKLFGRFDVEAGHFRRYDKYAAQELLARTLAGSEYQVEQYYFNIIGALGYWFVYKLLKTDPRKAANSEIGLFDKMIVPIMRRLEGKRMPFGISLITIITKG